jgi:signal peptidase I
VTRRRGSPKGSLAGNGSGSRRHRSRKRQPQGLVGLLRETVILLVLAVGLAVLFKTFLIQAFYIPSGSMLPTLEISDRVLVEKLSYRFGDVEHGDVVVFINRSEVAPEPTGNPLSRFMRGLGEAIGLVPPTEKDFIKRVIGLPGDRIECVGGRVIRNGQPFPEPYLAPGTVSENCGQITVPAGKLFVMGDNRGDSQDSRVFGPIDKSDVVGRAFVRLWPPGRMGWLRRDG